MQAKVCEVEEHSCSKQNYSNNVPQKCKSTWVNVRGYNPPLTGVISTNQAHSHDGTFSRLNFWLLICPGKTNESDLYVNSKYSSTHVKIFCTSSVNSCLNGNESDEQPISLKDCSILSLYGWGTLLYEHTPALVLPPCWVWTNVHLWTRVFRSPLMILYATWELGTKIWLYSDLFVLDPSNMFAFS